MTKIWLKPDLKAPVEPYSPERRYKVIEISYVWARTKKDALKSVSEGATEPEVRFAVEEQPKGWLGAAIKQILG